MPSTQLEEELKHFLQRDVKFRVGTKILKKGRLILFNVIEYYVVFTIETAFSNKRQTYEIPFPFKFHKIDPTTLLLDYQLKHIYNNNIEMKRILDKLGKETKSKYFDARVLLEATG